jgi:hypothetical protein
MGFSPEYHVNGSPMSQSWRCHLLAVTQEMNSHPYTKNVSQTKDKNYAHLSKSLARLSRAMGQTADLFEQLHLDLDAMRTLAGIHGAQ